MMGNEIPDDDEMIKQDLARRYKIYYKEEKEDNKQGRKIVRKDIIKC